MADEKNTEYVTLVSNDGYEFKLLRSAACIAGTIKRAMNPECKQTLEYCCHTQKLILSTAGFQETARNRMEFPTIKYATLPAPFHRPPLAAATLRRRHTAYKEKWCRTGESVRVSLLQPEACR